MSRNSVFLSSGDRDLGVAFKVHPGILASSHNEAKNSALFLSCHRYLLDLIEWTKGSQASCGVLRGDSGLFSRLCRKRRASSLNDEGISWFFSSCGTMCGFSRLRRGTHRASRVAPGKSSLHLSCEGNAALLLSHGRGFRPQDGLKGQSRGLSRVVAGNPGLS